MAETAPIIVWFRDDLRLADNAALHAAAASGRRLVCLYVLDDESAGLRPLGGAARWWLHGALAALDTALEAQGGRLLLARGAAATVIEAMATALGAGAVYWNRRYDTAGRTIDAGIKATLKRRDIAAESFNGALLREPWEVLSGSGTPFRVFAAYWRAANRLGAPGRPLPPPKSLACAPIPKQNADRFVTLASLGLLPTAPDWAGGMRDTGEQSEAAARRRLDDFIDGIAGYATGRDRPDQSATSFLSPYLRFGQISPRQVWHTAMAAQQALGKGAPARDFEKFLAELGWREFSYSLLYHEADLAQQNINRRFDAMPWRSDRHELRAWQRGMTGYPLVDAGMRELWTTGWMHNRVRMIVASFLTKHLLIDWRIGEIWFWDTLVDADAANNPASWQWVAGCGADAAPYFRIFNPTLQGEKFDPQGDYVRRWVPELARLPAPSIHDPSRAPPSLLAGCGVHLGKDYPLPIVAHDMARRRALDALATMKGNANDAED